MQGRVVLDFGPNGINIHSALADGNGQPAPDALVKAILLSAWEIMLTKCIAEGIKNERRNRLGRWSGAAGALRGLLHG